MSKLYEALQQTEPGPPQTRANPRGSAMPRLAIGSRQSMEALYQSLESALPGIARKVVLFSASHPGEGTTTIVREFALTLSLVFKASVLIVDANPNHGAARAGGDAEASSLSDLLRGLRASDAERAKPPGVTVAIFDAEVANGAAGQAHAGASLGEALREHFDYVLFDAPALGSSATAVSLARHVDGVVIVIDSERTRWPVVENTKKAYESTGAKVLGVILNKRAFYIPQWVYKWL
jgi:Mrp family chromosome partitioning ATPase